LAVIADAIGILLALVVVGVPSFLMILLVYCGEKSRRQELKKNGPPKRGFEVKLTGQSPVPEKKREHDHG
jgi:hypothetical protein